MPSCNGSTDAQEVVIKLGLVKKEKDVRPVFLRIKSSVLDLRNTKGTAGVETLKKTAVQMFLSMPHCKANSVELHLFDISLTYYDDCLDEVEIFNNDDIIDAFKCAKNGKQNIIATVSVVSNITAKQPLPVASVSSSRGPTNVSQSAYSPLYRPIGVNWIFNRLNSAAKSFLYLLVSNKMGSDQVAIDEEDQHPTEVDPNATEAEKFEIPTQTTVHMMNEDASNVAGNTMAQGYHPDPMTNTNRACFDSVLAYDNVVDHSTLEGPVPTNASYVESRKSEDKVTNESNPVRCFIHRRHTCDGCSTASIVGKRFTSRTIKDLYMCEKCAEKYTGPDKLVEEQYEHDSSYQDRWHEPWNRMMQERSSRRQPAARQTAVDDPCPFSYVFHTCDGFQRTPNIGTQLKSVTSDNFDLCANCMANYSGTDQFQDEQLDRWHMRFRNRRDKRSFDCYRKQNGRLYAILPGPEPQYTPIERLNGKNNHHDAVVEVIDLDAVMPIDIDLVAAMPIDTEDQKPHGKNSPHWKCNVPWRGFVAVDDINEPNTYDMVPTHIDPDLDEAIWRSLEDQKMRTEQCKQSESEKVNKHSNTYLAAANVVVKIDETDDIDMDDIQAESSDYHASRPKTTNLPKPPEFLLRNIEMLSSHYWEQQRINQSKEKKKQKTTQSHIKDGQNDNQKDGQNDVKDFISNTSETKNSPPLDANSTPLNLNGRHLKRKKM